MLKPIETEYRGYRFRSRLEARWAVFFDAIGEPYQYEIEGFDLNGVWYLPDFFLPSRQVWVEIKPAKLSQQEWQKVTRLAQASYLSGTKYTDVDEFGYEVELISWNNVWIISGDPWAEFDHTGFGTSVSYVVYESNIFIDGRSKELHIEWSHDVFVQCRSCSHIGLEGREFHFEPFISLPSEGGGYGICCSEKSGMANAAQLTNAYLTARQARFEHHRQ